MTYLRLIDRFSLVAEDYDVVLCDIWGVIHNSVVASFDAHDALSRFRALGGVVVLITNAPRPGLAVKRQLDELGVPEHAYDAIVASGDVTRSLITQRRNQSVCWIGPQRDRPLFDELDVQFAEMEAADYVVCTGLYDDESDELADYRDLFAKARARNLFMICANPDLVVERGTKLYQCAGALADFYQSLGGDVVYAGKPHSPIYEKAMASAAIALGKQPSLSRVIAIGDSIRTDIKGATTFGIDSLFVTSGIHMDEFSERGASEQESLLKRFQSDGIQPIGLMRVLAW